ncbi:hypothetical protein NIES4074_24040 [Cylindrospermum sp. NIES-4074]|nr:hypothetical protein NIES4074_24040 [Cylindrospermum sp. NIES-4074]
MTTKDFLEICGFCISLLAMGWRIAGIKASVEQKIAKLEKDTYKDADNFKDSLEKQINLLDKRLDLLTQNSKSEADMFKYQLDGQGKRLGGEIDNLKKRVSGVIVFERLEQGILKMHDDLKKLSQ